MTDMNDSGLDELLNDPHLSKEDLQNAGCNTTGCRGDKTPYMVEYQDGDVELLCTSCFKGRQNSDREIERQVCTEDL